MARQEKVGRCAICSKQGMVWRKGTNHILHLLLTLVTFGLWIIPWILMSVKTGGWRCSQCCGTRIEGSIYYETACSNYSEAVLVLTPFVRRLVPAPWDVTRELFTAVTDPRYHDTAYRDVSAAEECVSKLYSEFDPATYFVLLISSLNEDEHRNKPEARCALRISAHNAEVPVRNGYIALVQNKRSDSPRYLVFDFMEEAMSSLLNEAQAAADAAFRSVPDRGESIYIYKVHWREKPGGMIKSWQRSGPSPMASAAADAFAAVLKKHGIESWEDSRID